MARSKAFTELFIYMNGLEVGSLKQLSRGSLEMAYSKSWLENDLRRPLSLSMPLRTKKYTGDVVYNFFDNLLPDNPDIRARIQKRFGANTSRPFDLLTHIGVDCVGAIQLFTAKTKTRKVELEATPLSEKQMGDLLRSYRSAPLGMKEDTDFRISIAGAQEKTALLKLNKKWQLPKSSTPTTHIFKLPIGRIEPAGIDLSDSVENEFLCSKFMSYFALKVPEMEIKEFDGQKVLIVERFDRTWSKDKTSIIRLPQEDFCQAMKVAPALKYEAEGGPGIKNIMNFLIGSENSLEDRKNFLKVQFLFWLLGAIDGHAKNFSIFIEKEGAFKLTPFYDIMSAYPIIKKKQLSIQKIKLAMSLMGANKHFNWNTILPRHWLSTAKQCRFNSKDMQAVITGVLDNVEGAISFTEESLPPSFPAFIANSIFQGVRAAKKKFKASSA